MSSATQTNMSATRAMLAQTPVGEGPSGKPKNGGMSRRQLELNHLWAMYCAANYDTRTTDCNGHDVLDKLEHESIAMRPETGPGLVEARDDVPLKFRRPAVPYYLTRVIVHKFTGLLFSAKRHPAIKVADDAKTEEWLKQFVEESRLWAWMNLARNYGGSMGAVAVGFKFVKGKPKIEVFDPRWCIPQLVKGGDGELESLEFRYLFSEQMRDPRSGEWVDGWYWYRRTIDSRADEEWPKVPAEDGIEPPWDRISHDTVMHGFGFCPVVWIQNRICQDELDGWPDCWGIYDQIEGIDMLQSQGFRGTIANADPTLVLNSDLEWGDGIQKGSKKALHVEKGGGATYLELSGQGAAAALDMARTLRAQALEVAQCVIESNFDGPAKSEEEVTKNYASMLEAADLLREQYGECGVQKLLEMVLIAARTIAQPQHDKATGQVVKRSIRLKPQVIEGRKVERELGEGELISVDWPAYFDASLDDAVKAVGASVQATQGGLIDKETATRKIAVYFDVENPGEVSKKAIEEAASNEPADPFANHFLGQPTTQNVNQADAGAPEGMLQAAE